MKEILGRLFSPSGIKVMAKHVDAYMADFESSLPFRGLCGAQVVSNIRKETLAMTFGNEMKAIFSEAPSPNPEHQALHSIGQVAYSYFARPPLVDIGGGSFCSSNLRNLMGQLTDEGANLELIFRAAVAKIVERGFEPPEGEYVKNCLDVIGDAAKPSTNRHISGF